MFLYQIKDFIERHIDSRNVFVTSVDRLPRNFNLPMALCTNLSKSNEVGSHWVCITITENGVGEYFCSYGVEPKSREILSFLKMHCKSHTFNKKQIQQTGSDVCGYYCCLYLHYKMKNLPLEVFLKNFSNNLYLNDYGIEKMYSNFNKSKF